MSKARTVRNSVNFWLFLQNVFTASMNKGQFPLACFTFIIALLIYRLPSEDVSRLVNRIISDAGDLREESIALNVLLALSWAIHAKWQRRSISEEMDRIGKEKSSLQEQNAGRTLSHSNATKGTP
jgi:hypothetical protein